MDKLKELLSRCKASVTISVNDHRDYYMSVESHLIEHDNPEIPGDILREMISQNTVIRIQAYPDTPIGYDEVYHYDIDSAIELVLDAIKKDRGIT